MGSNMNSSVSSFVDRENVKAEMLDIIVGLYKEKNIPLSDSCKEFVLQRTGELLDYYDVGTRVLVEKLELSDGTLSEPYVKATIVDELFDSFRSKLAMIFLQLVSYDLAKFITEGEKI